MLGLGGADGRYKGRRKTLVVVLQHSLIESHGYHNDLTLSVGLQRGRSHHARNLDVTMAALAGMLTTRPKGSMIRRIASYARIPAI